MSIFQNQVGLTPLFQNTNETPEGNSTYDVSTPPADVQFFDGYGATMDDIKRGFIEPVIKNAPEYSLDNYKSRASMTTLTDDQWRAEHEFRMKGVESKGFLNRNCTDRNR